MLVAPTLDFAAQYDIAAASGIGVASATAAARLENQDNFLLIDGAGHAVFLKGQQLHEIALPDWPRGHMRLAVLDGMGGHGHGREAAEAVVDGLLTMPACANLPTLSGYLDALHTRLQARFAALDGGAMPARRPGTTLTLLEMAPAAAPLLYHVGDSRLYEVQQERIAVLTVDHVPATACVMAGVLDAHDWWQQVHGEYRSQIAQAYLLGNAFADPAQLADALYPLTAERLPPFLRHLPDRRALVLRADATYVLATDGFWACADPRAWVGQWPQLLRGCTSANAALGALFEAIACLPPNTIHADNLTAIIIRPLPRRDSDEITVAGIKAI